LVTAGQECAVCLIPKTGTALPLKSFYSTFHFPVDTLTDRLPDQKAESLQKSAQRTDPELFIVQCLRLRLGVQWHYVPFKKELMRYEANNIKIKASLSVSYKLRKNY